MLVEQPIDVLRVHRIRSEPSQVIPGEPFSTGRGKKGSLIDVVAWPRDAVPAYELTAWPEDLDEAVRPAGPSGDADSWLPGWQIGGSGIDRASPRCLTIRQ